MNIFKSVHDCKRMHMNNCQIARSLGISRNSVRKYARMSESDYERYRRRLLDRGKRFDRFREEIQNIYELNDPKKITASSVFDLLEERHGTLPAGERSLRNYLSFLEAEGLVETGPASRVYLPVTQLPAGRQLQVDFGQQKIASGKTAYLFCAILSHSRYRYVAVQDHPFTTREVICHLLDCFQYIGGRPEELVIDQDRLMIVSENAGDVITTRDFGIFIAEQELSLYVCRKGDPESKGKVENLVKFVKTSFFAARTFDEVSQITEKLSLWLTRRANGRLCQATGQIPAVMHETERKHLRPLKSSVYLSTRITNRDPREASAKGMISVAGSQYSVPLEYRRKTVEIYLCENELLVFDSTTHELITTHQKSLIPGEKVVKKAHFTRRSGSTQAIETEVAAYSPLAQWQSFLEENKERFPRHRREQISGIARVLEDQSPCQEVLGEAVSLCMENRTVSAANLADALTYFQEVHHEAAPDVLSILRPQRERIKGSEVSVAKRKPAYYSSLISILGVAS